MRTILVLSMLLGLSGCTSHVDFSSSYHLTATDRLPLTVDPKLEAKVESSSLVWEEGTYDLKPALARVIDNRPDAPSKIEYISSELSTHQGMSWFLTGMMLADYRLLVRHQTTSGKDSIIEARGKGVSYWNSFNAGQEAIEKAVLDLVEKVKASR